MKTQKCRSCGADIIWALSDHGKRMPVNAEMASGSGFVLEGDPPRARLSVGEAVHLSHFATCPQAGKWRKRDREKDSTQAR